MKNISIIVAIAENNGIGKNNDLLWHISADLKRFKQITLDHTVIMGKNTFFSLPVRPLKNRRSIVITDNRSDHFDGCVTVFSVDEAIKNCNEKEESFVIGGASIYRQFLPHADRLYLTRVIVPLMQTLFFRRSFQKNGRRLAGKYRGPILKTILPMNSSY